MPNTSIYPVCDIQDIPEGKMKSFNVSGKDLLLCNVGNTFYCVDNMCTHEDAPLYLGCLKGEEIQCSLHGGRFNVVTGKATVEPAEISLKTYKTIIDKKQLFVDVG
ncbi:MAG: Ferredoxin, 2Fe-2S [uncultured Thiotrichaceae bacterium]|uniref:Ferredoxin, 2Fe-2S n=1 Tax=uncultured Thiotrichaceae bacterium TaxID=298394 RepID=A0A6S6TT98_9GAMM|nr:MAG: Ferredoxin, 2Fe-2S [uncultured Thiotrichaceae bacterium]